MKNFITRNNQSIWITPLLYIFLLVIGKISATEVVILYAIETIVIGWFHIIKMLVITFQGKRTEIPKLMGLFYIFFFAVHYGFFVFIQTTFFFVFLSMEDSRITDSFGVQNFITVLQFQGVQIGLMFMIISYGLKFWFNFYKSGYYKTLNVGIYMFQPYLRIFIQQLVAILPGLFIIFGKAGLAVAIILIVIRTITDYYLDKMRTEPHFFAKIFPKLFKTLANKSEDDKERKQAEELLKMMINE